MYSLHCLKDKNFKVQYSNKSGNSLQKIKENLIELEYSIVANIVL